MQLGVMGGESVGIWDAVDQSDARKARVLKSAGCREPWRPFLFGLLAVGRHGMYCEVTHFKFFVS